MKYIVVFLALQASSNLWSSEITYTLPTSVAVFCASSTQINPLYKEVARNVGTFCAKHNMQIIFGGANTGLMGELADGALAAGGRVYGILPEAGRVWNVAHAGAQVITYVDTIYDRFAKFDAADAFIILPGGIGTLSELFNVLAQKQYGMHAKPILLINCNGYFDHLLDLLVCMVQENMIKKEHLQLLLVIEDVDELANALQVQEQRVDQTSAWWTR